MKRKAFLVVCSSLILPGFGIGTGCQKKTEQAASPPTLDCESLSGLSESDLQIRTSLAYADESPYSDQVCDNCQYWIAPQAEAACGGCVAIQGPIQAKGYCSYWAPKL